MTVAKTSPTETDLVDGLSYSERLDREMDEIMAALDRGDPSHVRAAEELLRRWERKGWRLEPPDRPGEPPKAVRINPAPSTGSD